jgi:hypothetical protein
MSLHFEPSTSGASSRVRLTAPIGRLAPSPSAGPDFKRMVIGLQGHLLAATAGSSVSVSGRPPIYADPTQAVFDNAVALKVATGKLAMHLSERYRTKLFSEVDRVLNIENWDDDSSLIDERSFATFLRAILYNKIPRVPSLGVSQGRLLASWHARGGAQLLYVEFLADDRLKILLTTAGDAQTSESAALIVPSRLLRERLSGLDFEEAVLDAA